MSQLNSRLLALATLLLVFSVGAVSYLALQRFQEGISPELSRKGTVVGNSIKSVLVSLIDVGIPLDKMTGVEEYLDSVRSDNPDVLYVGIADSNGRLLHQHGTTTEALRTELANLPSGSNTSESNVRVVDHFYLTTVPLTHHGDIYGYLYLGQDAAFFVKKMKELIYDVLTVLVVSGLISLELLRFVMALSTTTRLGLIRHMLDSVKRGDFSKRLPEDVFGRIPEKFNCALDHINGAYHALLHTSGSPPAALIGRFKFAMHGERKEFTVPAIDFIRWPFFLLIFADSLSLSFFPVYVDTLYTPSVGLSRQFVSGLPISVFMLVWALSMPWAGNWVDKVGFRRAFITGSAVTTVGLLLTGTAQGIYDLLVWRSITAVGYGLVFITGQSYIAKHMPPEQRTNGMAIFLASFFSGSLAGAAIGGILADRIGFQMTFFLSAVLGLAAAIFVYLFLLEKGNPSASPKKKLSLVDFGTLLKNKRFTTITLLAAVPSKVALTGFLYYSAPLYLKSLGNTQSDTGRMMMAYGLVIVLLSPAIARLADKLCSHKIFVSIGGYSSALAMLIMHYFGSTLGALISITLLGIAHSIGVSPQLALVNDFCQDTVKQVGAATTNGIFRLIERLGSVSGPIIAGTLITTYGFEGAFYGIGAICFVSITAFSALLYWFDLDDRRRAKLLEGVA